jgi:pyruvate dehydrogenase E2 component (dihydrolipoamide acetyltransferase)
MALTQVIMPRTGAEMEEGRILAWKKREGERIERGEVLLEIETDKATMEVEAPISGFFIKRLYREGEVAPATRLIAILGDGHDSPEDVQRLIRTEGEAAPAPKPAAPVSSAQPIQPAATEGDEAPIKASPLARRLASEKGIDLASIQGTGPGGRIEKDDVLRAATAKAAAASTPEIVVPLTMMRRAIARRVSHSKQEMPDFSVTMSMDMRAALQRKKKLEAAGKHVSITDLIIFCGFPDTHLAP